jgi:hypothetical protein
MAYKGARFERILLDEMAAWTDPTKTLPSTQIHEAIERGGVDPATAREAISEFAAHMRETVESDVYDMLDRRGYFDIPAPTMLPGRLHRAGAREPVTKVITVDDVYTLFDVDGSLFAAVDPARPETADSGEFVDTIAPLEDLE